MLGEFRTMCTPARWIASENLFIPPVRNVHFDSSITIDPEEIFLQSLAEIHRLTPEESLKQCEEMVAEFHKMLVTEGSVDFGSIGVFTLEDDAEITMASCECGVTTPSYYGLDALHFKKLEHVVEEMVEQEVIIEQPVAETADTVANTEILKEGTDEANAEITPIEAITVQEETDNSNQSQAQIDVDNDDKHLTIRIKKSIVKYALTIAATIALFFIIRPTQITNNHVSNQAAVSFIKPNMVQPTIAKPNEIVDDMLSVEETDSFDAVLVDITQEALNEGYDFAEETRVQGSNETVIPATVVPTAAPTKENTTNTDKTVTKTETTSVAVTTTKTSFNVVLASAISLKNAQAFIEKLAKENVKASINENGNLRRVVVSGFKTKDDARQYIKTMRKSHSDFKNAWVIEL